jgi:hypothetical protein
VVKKTGFVNLYLFNINLIPIIMKVFRIFIPVILALLIAGKANSQLNLVIFTEKGEKFTAYVGGSPVNDKPATRIETTRPGGPSFKVRILFENSSYGEITKSIFNTPGDLYYVIRVNDKGKYILEKTESEYVKHNEESSQGKTAAVSEEKPAKEEPKSDTKPAGEGKGCSNPMSEPNFYASREMISNAPFDGPKLTQAKSMADKNCLTTTQIVDVMYIFSGESSRLSFAKYAYKHCWDPDNYETVKDALNASGKKSLQEYIDTQK